jgi:excisionase family DNA binding protein
MTATRIVAHAPDGRIGNAPGGGENHPTGCDVTRRDATHRRPGGYALPGRAGGTVGDVPTSRRTTSAPVDTAPAPVDTSPPPLAAVAPHLAAVADGLTPAEVAELLHVDVYTIRKWVNQGVLPGYRIGRSLRISTAALDTFVANRLVRS